MELGIEDDGFWFINNMQNSGPDLEYNFSFLGHTLRKNEELEDDKMRARKFRVRIGRTMARRTVGVVRKKSSKFVHLILSSHALAENPCQVSVAVS